MDKRIIAIIPGIVVTAAQCVCMDKRIIAVIPGIAVTAAQGFVWTSD